MSTTRSYAVLAGQLVLVLGIAVVVGAGVQALGGPAPHIGVLTAGVGTALVLASAKARRMEGTASDPALAGCQVLIPLDRWPVGGLWQSRFRRRTRAGWAPGVLGLAPGRAVFAPSRAKEADRAWQDEVRAVQLHHVRGLNVTALRVHGRRNGTVQLVAQQHWEQVRPMVEQVLPVTEGWEESMPEESMPEEMPREPWDPGRSWPVQHSVRLLLADDTETRVEVVTWYDRVKAEAIARGRYGYLHPDGPAVREAVVVDMGPAPRSADGRPDLKGMAFDRGEW